MTGDSAAPTPTIDILKGLLNRAHRLLQAPELRRSAIFPWTRAVHSQLLKIYGKDFDLATLFPLPPSRPSLEARQELRVRVTLLENFVDRLEKAGREMHTPYRRTRIFIGHGRSPLWREFKDFIEDRLGLLSDQFNRESAAGLPTSDRLWQMMSESMFAFLIMTAEEEHLNNEVHARPNVIHELGLFQGHLGFPRAIILLEEGCAEFTNIVGLTQIRFPRDDISARFEEVRRVLEREGLV